MTAVERASAARRLWLREIAIRSSGSALLVACGFASRALYRLANLPPAHEANAFELLLAVAVFLTFACGLALLFQGGGLFELIPVPPRNRYTGF
jgi:hypothetical protein